MAEVEITLKNLKKELPTLLSQDASSVTNISIYNIEEHCRQLLITLFDHFCHMEMLHLHSVVITLDDSYLQIIGERLTKLRTLSISNSTSMTDDGLRYLTGDRVITMNCPLLECITIVEAPNIAGHGLYRGNLLAFGITLIVG